MEWAIAMESNMLSERRGLRSTVVLPEHLVYV